MDLDLRHFVSVIDDDSVRVEQTQKKQVEYTLIGTKRKRPGLILFCYNKDTKEISRAKIDRCDTIDYMTQRPIRNDRVIANKNSVYMYALNEKNFRKHLIKEGIIC